MDKTELNRFLRRTPFLDDLEDSHIASLVELASEVTIPGGQRLLTMGEPADYSSVVVSGSIQLGIVREDRLVPIDTVGPRGFLGWSPLIPPYRWTYDAETVTETCLIQFPGEALRELCESDAAFGVAMMTSLSKAITQRLMATRMLLLDSYC